MAAILEALPEQLIEELIHATGHADYDATLPPPGEPTTTTADAPSIDVLFILRLFVTLTLALYAIAWLRRRRRS